MSFTDLLYLDLECVFQVVLNLTSVLIRCIDEGSVSWNGVKSFPSAFSLALLQEFLHCVHVCVLAH